MQLNEVQITLSNEVNSEGSWSSFLREFFVGVLELAKKIKHPILLFQILKAAPIIQRLFASSMMFT
jgi:hypothetical protein